MDSCTMVLAVFTTRIDAKLLLTIRVGFITNLLRIVSSSFASILVVNTASTIVQESIRIPYYAEFYQHADREGRIEYLMLMELGIDALRAFFWGMLMVLSLTLPLATALRIGFAIAAASTLLIGKIRLQPASAQQMQ